MKSYVCVCVCDNFHLSCQSFNVVVVVFLHNCFDCVGACCCVLVVACNRYKGKSIKINCSCSLKSSFCLFLTNFNFFYRKNAYLIVLAKNEKLSFSSGCWYVVEQLHSRHFQFIFFRCFF